MRILVTGAYGFIGMSLSMRLLDMGHQVLGIDRLRAAQSPKASRVAALGQRDGFKHLELDLGSTEGWTATQQALEGEHFDNVIHLAGQYSRPASRDIALQYAKTDVAHWNIFTLAAMRKLSRVLYASSTFVEYASMLGVSTPWLARPTTYYGANKVCAEYRAAAMAQQHGYTTVGLRYGSTIGPHSRDDIGAAQLTLGVLKRRRLTIRPGSGYHYQTAFLSVHDAVEATLRLLEAPLSPGLDYAFTIVANDHRYDLGELLRMIEKHAKQKALIDWSQYTVKAPGGVPLEHLEALHKVTGWLPEWTVDRAVAEYVAWFKGRR